MIHGYKRGSKGRSRRQELLCEIGARFLMSSAIGARFLMSSATVFLHYAFVPLCLHSIYVRMRAAHTGVRYLSVSFSLLHTHTHTHTHKVGRVCYCVVCIDYPLLSIAVFTNVFCLYVSIRQHTPAYGTVPASHHLHGKAGKLR